MIMGTINQDLERDPINDMTLQQIMGRKLELLKRTLSCIILIKENYGNVTIS